MKARIWSDDKKTFLSIITTGIDRNKNRIFLLNLYDGEKLKQYKFPENKEEFENDVKDLNVITYNGNSFDIPFLKANDISIEENFDLYSFLKSYKLLGLQSYKFKEVYRHFTSKDTGELEAKEIVKLIKDYEKTNDENNFKKILSQGERHIKNLLKLFKEVESQINKEKIELEIYNKNIKLLPYSFKEEGDYFDILLLNMGEFINMNLEFNTFSLFSKDYNYILRFKTIRGYLDEKTIGKCVITDLNLKDENFPKLNKNLYPIEAEKKEIENIKNLARTALKSVGKKVKN
ncbi:ribonuclease H-like domain-containing protein [Lagierella massiliensis]|uniref:ribonuclease H-like domain-containing protein n=1 Tax=Lagierella massiliensis TaxID=1689303 RepID=UPI0006D79770|nr:ribonuclease H-like domain-containing protein [Lagierella massiliensis]